MRSIGEPFAFSLPDRGTGVDTPTASDLADENDYVVAALLSGHYCPASRQFVQALTAHEAAFDACEATVVPVLPDTRERAAVWERRYDTSRGVLADPSDDDATDDAFDVFAPFDRLLPDRPGAVVFETDGDDLRFVDVVGGDAESDRPTVDALLDALADRRESALADPVEATVSPGTRSDS